MKVQCPICRQWQAVPEALTLPAKWSHHRRDGLTEYSLTASNGRLIAEVWRNVEYGEDGVAILTDWHWQYNPLDRCCGQLPCGNAPTSDGAKAAAIEAFTKHGMENKCAVIGPQTPPRFVLDNAAWKAGFAAGQAGDRQQPAEIAQDIIKSRSWYSGWIEGEARRLKKG